MSATVPVEQFWFGMNCSKEMLADTEVDVERLVASSFERWCEREGITVVGDPDVRWLDCDDPLQRHLIPPELRREGTKAVCYILRGYKVPAS